MDDASSENTTAVGWPPAGKLILRNLQKSRDNKIYAYEVWLTFTLYDVPKAFKIHILETFTWSIIQLKHSHNSISASCLHRQYKVGM